MFTTTNIAIIILIAIFVLMLTWHMGCAFYKKQVGNTRSIEDPSQQDELAKKYREAYDSWKRFVQSPEIQESSRTEDYTDNQAYENIVALGKRALPFLIADIEKGEFFLNNAVKRITNIDVIKLYPDEKVTGEQDISKLWVRWWREKGKSIYSTRPK
ncbi:hypothetical protein FJZ31_29755 [Candidatus Poribacteria bacterium]|nr:hypothetical protein [Candidatus Poribacteria bacterium]